MVFLTRVRPSLQEGRASRYGPAACDLELWSAREPIGHGILATSKGGSAQFAGVSRSQDGLGLTLGVVHREGWPKQHD